MQLGDALHKVFQPIAEKVIDPLLGTDISHCSGCQARQEWFNQLGNDIWDELFQPKKQKDKNNAISSDPNNN